MDFGFVLMIRLGFGFCGEEDHRGKVSFSSVHIKGPYNHTDLGLLLLTLIIWLKWFLSGFSTVKWFFLIPSPLSYCTRCIGVTVCPRLRSGELCSPSLKYSISNLFGILHRRMSLLPHVWIDSVVYLYQYGLVDIFHFGLYNLILWLDFVAAVVLALATGSCSCHQLLCFFAISPSVCVCFWTFLYFLALQNDPGSSCVFPAPVLESAISLRAPGSFYYWRMVFETQYGRCYYGIVFFWPSQLTG